MEHVLGELKTLKRELLENMRLFRAGYDPANLNEGRRYGFLEFADDWLRKLSTTFQVLQRRCQNNQANGTVGQYIWWNARQHHLIMGMVSRIARTLRTISPLMGMGSRRSWLGGKAKQHPLAWLTTLVSRWKWRYQRVSLRNSHPRRAWTVCGMNEYGLVSLYTVLIFNYLFKLNLRYIDIFSFILNSHV